MAKRKTNNRTRKSSAASGKGYIRKFGKWLCLSVFVVSCFVASHYIYDYLNDVEWKKLAPSDTKEIVENKVKDIKDEVSDKAEDILSDIKETDIKLPSSSVSKSTEKPKSQEKKDEKTVETKKTINSAKAERLSGLEIPSLIMKKTEQVIKHEGYTVSYNSDYRIANWVAYELTKSEAKSTRYSRSNKFVPDPDVKGATAMNEDYSRTGFDKGHLAPAGDMKWSAKAMRESFYFSNICPQIPGLNRGIWRELEEQCRLWASDNGVLYVATGPVITGEMRRLGKHRVGVPAKFYKVLCTIVNGKYEATGFLFDNKDYDNDAVLKSFMVPVDKVEEITGIDFFPKLPDGVEKEIESRVNFKAWSY